ncbi:MAG: 16S rRNA (cytosine(967)-C(5))-methyltransferase RsmB [Acutalibacteraceae bacterium]|nr:16S rRNA (cytosine(967)-C(5))-methyltransferase RsmB [Acutalibacteraceae bacterium]
MNSPRYVAATALLKVTGDGGYSNLVLGSLLDETLLSAADKALATAIFYGTLDRMVTVDFYLKKLIKTPLKKLAPYTLSVLRTAVYQIKYMDKIPQSAAVNEAVKLVKNSKEGFNASFVNGVLRNLIRTEILLPTGNSIYDISVSYSCPDWIVSILIRDYGIDFTKNFLKNALKAPPVFLRVNTHLTDKQTLINDLKAEGADTLNTALNTALLLSVNGSVEGLSSYRNGHFFVQDLSCQQAIAMLDIKPHSRVLDLCAAPGGKSFSAALYAAEGRVMSCDLYEHRAGLILKGAERLGLNNLTVKASDATLLDDELGTFDRIICDVPCSGLGVIRRKPDIKYKPRDSFEELVQIQRQILKNADNYLETGGTLLYSTCTLNKAENRENVDWFLENHPGYSLVVDKTFSPDTNDTDGFYAAILKKNK